MSDLEFTLLSDTIINGMQSNVLLITQV